MGRERKRPKGAATFVATFRVGFSPSQRRKATARFNAGTALYNAALCEALDRADAMRADPRWQKARTLPKNNPTRKALFNQARTAAGDAQLVCDGDPARRYETAEGVVGLDLGPSAVAVVSDEGAFLETFCDGLGRNEAEVRRLQRKLDRQHRAGSPDCFDAKGRHPTGRCPWVRSGEARSTALRLVEAHRRKAECRKSLHGNLVNRVLGQGTTIHVEKLSKVAWQKMYGRSVGFRAPGMFETLLSRKAANAGGSVVLINPYAGRLSQRCVCGSVVKKPLSLRVHACPCGVREQRDVWSAFLARHSSGQATDLANARTELRHRQDVGGAPRPGGSNLRVPAAGRLVPAAAGRAGGVA